MRWILAGIAFALLVTLAVVTVVIKAGNRQTQGRLEHLTQALQGGGKGPPPGAQGLEEAQRRGG